MMLAVFLARWCRFLLRHSPVVRVRLFRTERTICCSEPLKGLSWCASVAAVPEFGAVIARHEFLFREAGEVAKADEVGAFNGSSGRESPAGAAFTLILYGGDLSGLKRGGTEFM